jgi:hypothetical protein
MKHIERTRLETFLNQKGYQKEFADELAQEKQSFAKWIKSGDERVNLPKKDILHSTELPGILKDPELLNEFRRF